MSAERIASLALLVVLLPALGVIALILLGACGSPVLDSEEVTDTDGSVLGRRLRFRSRGCGRESSASLGRILRNNSLDALPGLWSVACGEVRLNDLLRGR
ncbi:MAG: sugar transferase [Verrucomicrobia bacterium]|nr:sugar transferase [Verrucomicrobiota bacterium]